MSSPFTIFRKHQRILMVIATGLAMVSFVLLGAVNDPSEMPPALVILALAAMVGGVGWMLGLTTGKASEWGVTGLAIGAVCGLAMNLLNRTPDAVLMNSGNMSRMSVAQVRRDRDIANYFVQRAFAASGQVNPYALPQYLFGVNKNDPTVREVVLDELLRREANSLGITISDDAVFTFMTEVSGGKLTQEQFKEIREATSSKEHELVSAIKNELKAKEALRVLYPEQFSRSYPEPLALFLPSPAALPPEALWEFHQKLNVRKSAEIVEVPVSAFVDKTAKPTDAQRQELFAQYRANYPLVTPDGRLEEGRPGFRQPRKVRLGYLEAVFEDIEATVGEVSDAEIQKLYEERYLRAIPGSTETLETPLLPALPATPAGTPPTAPAATPDPETSTAPAANPAPASETKTESTPATPAPNPDPPATPSGSPAAPATPAPSTETPPSPEPEKPPGGGTSQILRSRLIPVAFYDDQPATAAQPDSTATPPAAAADSPASTPAAAETPAAAAAPAAAAPAATVPAASTPAAETPATTPATPATATTPPAAESTPPPVPTPEKSDGSSPPASSTPATNVVPPPPSGPPALDDLLKGQLRDEILRTRTEAEITKRIAAAHKYMQDLSYNRVLGPDEPNFIKTEDIGPALKKYAQEHGLTYVETDFLSPLDLQKAEDYPIGTAYDEAGQIPVVNKLFSTQHNSYIPSTAVQFDLTGGFRFSSSFAYWKIEELGEVAPETLADKKLVEQVDEVWRLQQALPKAQARADELAKQLTGNEKSAAELFGEVTVTGQEGSVFLTVAETGDVTWMSRSTAPQTNMMPSTVVRETEFKAVPKAGERFRKKLFEDLQPGQVGVAANFDNTSLYVIRVKTRYPGTDAEMETLRKDFIAAGNPTTYSTMAEQSMAEYSSNWIENLWQKHDVQLTEQLDQAGGE